MSSITYDSSENKITVIGFSESSPCTFEDIYQASQNNGWGVVNKQNGIQYVINAKLRIGDGSTETWFKDIKKHIIITPATNDAFYVDNNAVFQLGEKDPNGNPYNGCVFWVPNYEGDSAFYGYDNGAWRLYDSMIYYPAFLYLWSRGSVPPAHEIIGCRFLKFMGMRIAGESSIVKDIVMHSDSKNWDMIGLTFKGKIAKIENIFSYKLKYGAYWSPLYGQSDTTLSNIKIRDCEYAIRVFGEYGNYSMYLIDADIDNWNIKWENVSTDANKIYRQYTFSVKVTDKNGNPIEGAVVELWDKDNNKIFTEVTGYDGNIPVKIVTYGYYAYPTGNTLNLFSPHKVKVSKSGYTPLEAEITIDRPMKNLVWQLDALNYTLDEIMNELQNHRNAAEPNIDAIKAQTDKMQFDLNSNIQARVNDKGVLNDPSVDDIDDKLSSTHGSGSWEGSTPEQVADAVWNEQIDNHQQDGSTGKTLKDTLIETKKIPKIIEI